MAFKLHKVRTVLRHVIKSWPDSACVKRHCPQKNRIGIYFSLLYWFFFYGTDYINYCSFRFWTKSSAEKKSYISSRRNDRLRFTLSTPEVYSLFLDKARFNQRFSKYITRKWISAASASELDLEEFIVKTKSIIAKPLSDFGGHGVLKFEVNQSDRPSVKQLHESNYMLEECIQNEEYLKKIAPGSLNTIRIVTLIDKKGELHVLAALLRMGNGVAFTDNYLDGGMACAIDIETGRLKEKAFGMGSVEYEKHPLSGIKFDGYYICDFKKCLELVRQIAFEEPSARYVGWDLAITPNGIELIEGNIPPGENITQIAAGHGLWYEVNELI